MTFCVCRLCKDHGHDFIKDVNGHPYFTQINIRGVRKMLKVWICRKCVTELRKLFEGDLKFIGTAYEIGDMK
tara:strand:- start:350 stop:565 length:216 start_codon:yes stop_codon:yes gene_type:complete